MGITAISGPQIAYGITLSSSGAIGEYNEQRGPSACDLGEMLLDPRPGFSYQPGLGIGSPNSSSPSGRIFGWAGLFGGPVVDQIPSSGSTNSVIASTTGAGVTLTLQTSAAATGGGITTITGFVPSTYSGLANPSSISVIGMDCAAGTQAGGLAFGSAGTVNIWDPTHLVSRCLTINTTGTTPVLTIKGFDIYGFQMSQVYTSTFTATTGGTVTTGKAFKYIQSITASSAGANNFTIGISDVYGFPLRADHPAYVQVWWGPSSAATLVTLSSGLHTFASTAAATTTTGDVRGTISLSTAAAGASNGTNKLVMIQSPSAQNLQAMSLSSLAQSSLGNQYAGLVGVPQA